MQMLFGLYYIPFETDYYKTGSEIIGYDILNQKHINLNSFIKKAWVTESSVYGFHMTMTDAVTINESDLPVIEQKIQNVLNTFSKNLELTLNVEEIGFWPKNKTQLAIRLIPNDNVKTLHDVLVSTIQILGRGSLYVNLLEKQTAENDIKYLPDQVKKIKMFYAPYIFEHFKPHFTLLNPVFIEDSEMPALEKNISELFDTSVKLEMNSLTMVIKNESEKNFKVYKTFPI